MACLISTIILGSQNVKGRRGRVSLILSEKKQIKGGLGRMSFEGHVILQNEFEVKLKSSQTLSSVLLQFILSATSGFDGAQSPTTDSK